MKHGFCTNYLANQAHLFKHILEGTSLYPDLLAFSSVSSVSHPEPSMKRLCCKGDRIHPFSASNQGDHMIKSFERRDMADSSDSLLVGCTLWLCQHSYYKNGPVEIVDLPIQNGGSFHSKLLVYQSFPEAIFSELSEPGPALATRLRFQDRNRGTPARIQQKSVPRGWLKGEAPCLERSHGGHVPGCSDILIDIKIHHTCMSIWD